MEDSLAVASEAEEEALGKSSFFIKEYRNNNNKFINVKTKILDDLIIKVYNEFVLKNFA